jgi:hypothetical protein
MDEITKMQIGINTLMRSQLDGDFDELNPAYEQIRQIAKKRFINYGK